MTDIEDIDVVHCQENNPDNRSDSDQQLHQIDQSSSDAKSIRITPPTCTLPEALEQSIVQHPSSPSGDPLLEVMWRSPDRIHQISIQDRQNRKFKNLPVDGVADAVARALKLSSEGTEVYFACAEYLTPDSRTAANASGACSFWLDIDCGEEKAATGKGYATDKDAEEALGKFCQDTGLPTPTHIVHSGGGLHTYWVLDGIISRVEWQASARKLKAVTKACGFLADPSRTADIASVLRILDTLNHKYTPPRPVLLKNASEKLIERSTMLDAIVDAYNRLCNTVTAKPSSRPSIATVTIVRNVDASHYGPPDLDKLASALALHDPDCDEETWKLRRIAPLADTARNYPDYAGDLYELARSWSSGDLRGKPSEAWNTPGGNGFSGEEVFDDVWLRFLNGEYTGVPVTVATVYYDAMQAGWNPDDQFQIIDVAVEGDA